MDRTKPSNWLLDSVAPFAEEIMYYTGIPGLSYGVFHRGRILGTRHLGVRDVDSGAVADDDTQFPIMSLTKGFTAALAAAEAHSGRHPDLGLDKPVRAILGDDFRMPAGVGDWVADNVTPADLLSHRSGVGSSIAFSGLNGEFLYTDPKDTMAYLAASSGDATWFRSHWNYNNGTLNAVAQVIERSSGKRISDMMRDQFFGPLGMDRTTLGPSFDDDNITRHYSVLDDKMTVKVPSMRFKSSDHQFLGSAGVHSTMRDLLLWYSHFVTTLNDQLRRGDDSTPGSPIKMARSLAVHQSRLPGGARHLQESGYGLGWFRHQTPVSLMFAQELGLGDFAAAATATATAIRPVVGGGGGANTTAAAGDETSASAAAAAAANIPVRPVLGKGLPPMTILHHFGLYPGSTSAVYVVPELDLGVVVLQNSSTVTDTCGLVAQMVLNAVMEASVFPLDYVDYIRAAYSNEEGSWREINAAIEARRQRDKPAGALLEAYVGRYREPVSGFVMDILRLEEGTEQAQLPGKDTPALAVRLNGLESQEVALEHLGGDLFSWFMSNNDLKRKNIDAFLTDAGTFLLDFEVEDGVVKKLNYGGSPNVLIKEDQN